MECHHHQQQQIEEKQRKHEAASPEAVSNLTKKEAANLVTELLTFPFNANVKAKLGNDSKLLQEGDLVLDGEGGDVGTAAVVEDEKNPETDDNDSKGSSSLFLRLLPETNEKLHPIDVFRKIANNVEVASKSFDSGDVDNDDAHRHHSRERAHQFEIYTYQRPTYCDVCDGLLVGLWRQGRQCQHCGMNVHHGEGKGEHDDCKAEALLTACWGEKPSHNERRLVDPDQQQQPPIQFPDWQQIQRFFQNHPNLWEEFTEQTEKDFMKNITEHIIEQATDNERTRKIKRAREYVILPTLRQLTSAENVQLPFFPILWLLSYHIVALTAVAILTAMMFGTALLPTDHGVTSDGILLHTATVGLSIQVDMVVFAVLMRYLSLHFKRKEMIVDNFLQEVATLHVEEDFGVSVQNFSAICRRWSDRFVVTNAIMLVMNVMIWYHAEQAFTKALLAEATMTLLPPQLNGGRTNLGICETAGSD
jgi:hypothetical protein